MPISELSVPRNGRRVVAAILLLGLMAGCTSSGSGEIGLGNGIDLSSPPSCETSGCVGDGIDTADGSFSTTVEDLLFPTGLYGVELERSYRSNSVDVGMFGPGWATVYDTMLKSTSDGLTVVAPVGLEPRWRPEAPPAWGMSGSARVSGAGGGRQIEWPSGEKWSFDAEGRLAKMESPYGQSVTIERVDGVPASIRSSQGVNLTFEVSNGRVAAVSSSDQRRVSYEYVEGVLAGVEAPGLAHTYRYNTDKRMLEFETPSGTTAMTYVDGKVASQTLPTGQRLVLTYANGATNVRSEIDRTYEHDESGRLTRVTQSGAELEVRAFDDEGRLTSMKTFAQPGNVKVSELVREYRNGRLSSETLNGAESSWTYDDRGRVVGMRSVDGPVSFAYGGDGPLPVAVVTRSTGRQEFTYTDGFLTGLTDATGVTTSSTRDSQGNTTATAEGEEAAWSFGFDAEGNEVSRTSPSGRVWTAEWAPRRLLNATVDPVGRRSQYVYDDAGRVLEQTEPSGVSTSYQYDADGRLRTVVGPDGAETTYEYDPVGRLAATTLPGNRTWRSTTELLVNGGSVVTVTAPDGTITESTLDTDGRETGRRHLEVDGTVVEERTFGFEFDRQVLEAVQRGSSRLETQTTYDDAGRAVRVVRSLDGVELSKANYSFEDGRLVEVSNAKGSAAYSYDAAGRLVKVSSADDVWSAAFAGGRLSSTSHNGETTTVGYDLDGRATSFVDPLGVPTEWKFDDVDRPVSRSVGDATATFEWSAGDDLVGYRGPTGSKWRWEHDAAGRLTKAIEPGGRVTEYQYENGAVVRIKSEGDEGRDDRFEYDSRGLLQHAETATGKFTYSYDAVGALKSVDGPGDREDWTRDAAGNVVGVQVGNDSFTLRYDSEGRLTAAVGADKQLLAGWNSNGLASISASGRDDIGITTDAEGRLSSVGWDENTTIDLGWAADSSRLQITERDSDSSQEYRLENGRIASFIAGDVQINASYLDNGSPEVLKIVSEDNVGEVRFDQLARPATLVANGATATLSYDAEGRVASAVASRPGSEPKTTTVTYATDKGEIDGDSGFIKSLFSDDGSLRAAPPTSLEDPVSASSPASGSALLDPSSAGDLLVAPEPKPLDQLAASVREVTPTAIAPIGVQDLPRLAEQMAVAEIDRLAPVLKADGRLPVRLPVINPKDGHLAEFNPFKSAAGSAKALGKLSGADDDSLFERVLGKIGDFFDGAVRIGREIGQFLIDNQVVTTLVTGGLWVAARVICGLMGPLCGPVTAITTAALVVNGVVNLYSSAVNAMRACPQGDVAECGLSVIVGVVAVLEIRLAFRALKDVQKVRRAEALLKMAQRSGVGVPHASGAVGAARSDLLATLRFESVVKREVELLDSLTGVSARADSVTRSLGGRCRLVESKYGPSAGLTPNQKIVYSALRLGTASFPSGIEGCRSWRPGVDLQHWNSGGQRLAAP